MQRYGIRMLLAVSVVLLCSAIRRIVSELSMCEYDVIKVSDLKHVNFKLET